MENFILGEDNSPDRLGTKERPIETFQEYLKVMQDLYIPHPDFPGQKLKESQPFSLSNFYLFRGVVCEDFDLVARIHYDWETLRPRKKSYIKALEKILREELEGLKIKKPSSAKELKICKERIRKLEFEIDHLYAEAIEKQMFISWRNRSRLQIKVDTSNDWDWLALARHHKVSTRLLDWSRDPQIALWFAVSDDISFRDKDGIVYAFEPRDKFQIVDNSGLHSPHINKFVHLENPFTMDDPDLQKEFEKKGIEKIILFRPPTLHERIDSQSSWFTSHPFVGQKGERPMYEKLEPDGMHKNHFRKIYIKADRKFHIRRELKLLGVDESAVYKDLDNLGMYQRNTIFKMADEVFSDETLIPGRITKTFQRLQSNIGLYNSCEVAGLEYRTVRSCYEQLITYLCDNKNPVTRFWAFNNMNREYLSYKDIREVYLDVLKSKVETGGPLDYKRVQFFINKKDVQNPGLKDETVEQLIFNNSFCWIDKLSTDHARVFKNSTKYCLFDYTDPNKNFSFEMCGFVLIEREVTQEFGNKKIERHLLLEFNHQLLSRIVHEANSMCFWLTFHDEDIIKEKWVKNLDIDEHESMKTIYQRYADYFETIYNCKDQSDRSLPEVFDHDQLAVKCKFMLKKLLSDTKRKDYLFIHYTDYHGQKPQVLPIPLGRKRACLANLNTLIEYIRNKLGDRGIVLVPNSFGNEWSLYQDKDCYNEIDHETNCLDISGKAGKYKEKYYGQSLVDLGILGKDKRTGTYFSKTELWFAKKPQLKISWLAS